MSDIDTIDQRFGDIVAGLNTGDRRLFAELVHLTDHPELWVQGTWAETAESAIADGELPPEHQPAVCGSVGCLAGNLVITAGVVRWEQPTPGGPWEQVVDEDRARELNIPERAISSWGVDWPKAANALIGHDDLDEPDSGPGGLFNGNNTLAKLWEIAGDITDGRVRCPAELWGRVQEIDRVRTAWYRQERDQ